MQSMEYDKLPKTEFPTGTYVILHTGTIPACGFVLSDVKIVQGWPNPVLESVRSEERETPWLTAVDALAFSNDRPDFNLGVYQVNGVNYPVAVYGSLEHWSAPFTQQRLFRDFLRSIPDELQHLAHIF